MKIAYFKRQNEEIVKLKYDFIHIVPPMRAVKAIEESSLVFKKGQI